MLPELLFSFLSQEMMSLSHVDEDPHGICRNFSERMKEALRWW